MHEVSRATETLRKEVERSIRTAGPYPNNAGKFQRSIRDILVLNGWAVQPEVMVDDRGDGRRGRVDMVARRGEHTIAVECDNQSPRWKSLIKMGQLDADAYFCVLRTPAKAFLYEDVHCFGVEVFQ